MSFIDRRAELMRILICRRKSNIHELAEELNVSTRTIQRDIQALVPDYPLESISGNGGGICLPDWYYPNKNLLSREEMTVLEELISKANEHQRLVLKQMLAKFGPNTYRPCKA